MQARSYTYATDLLKQVLLEISLPDDAPYVEDVRQQQHAALAMLDELSRLKSCPEVDAWTLGCEELWIRNTIWEAVRKKTQGFALSDVEKLTERYRVWSERADIFVRSRYLPKDADIFRADRIDGLGRAIAEL